MLDPITFGYLVLSAMPTVISAAFNTSHETVAKEIVKAVVGNLVTDGLKTVPFLARYSSSKMVDLARRIAQNNPNEQVNHDIQKAARKAQLTATLLACRACLEEMKSLAKNSSELTFGRGSQSIFSQPGEKWILQVKKYLEKNLKEFATQTYRQPPESGFDELLTLANPLQTYKATDCQQELVAKLKQATIDEIESQNYPDGAEEKQAFESLKEKILNGWKEFVAGDNLSVINNEEPFSFDWHELACGFFAEEYKTNDRVKSALDATLLFQIKQDVSSRRLPENTDTAVAETFSQFQANTKTILERLDAEIRSIRGTQDETLRLIKENYQEILNAFENFDRQLRNIPEATANALMLELRELSKENLIPFNAEREIFPARYSSGELSEIREQYCLWLIKKLEFLQIPNYRVLPLENIYVTLRAVKANQFERRSSQSLIDQERKKFERENTSAVSPNDEQGQRWRFLSNLPEMYSISERDLIRASPKFESHRLGEIIEREPRCVIMGDPGSGKTTLACWLALQAARTIINSKEIDPNAENAEEENDADKLPTLPLLVRVADFAEACRDGGYKSLIDYLGRHPWRGDAPEFSQSHPRANEKLPENALNALAKHHLKNRRAVVILDGLDEVKTEELREKVVTAVDEFIRDYINGENETALNPNLPASFTVDSAFVNPNAARSAPPDGKKLGNQIITTSRIAGYHIEPLKGDFNHFTIEPMSRSAIDDFCRTLLNGLLSAEKEYQSLSEKLASLLEILHDERRLGLNELSSNPLLLTLLITIFHKDGTLPVQRAELYQMTFQRMLDVWKKRNLALSQDEKATKQVFSHLALTIHDTSAKGFISQPELIKNLKNSLTELNDERFPPTDETAKEIVRVLRDESGLIVARAQFLYGFLHLTFQEYFAGLWLIAEPEQIIQRITEKIEDPRWREPILLALSQMDLEKTADELNDTLLALLTSDNSFNRLLPNMALLLSSAAGSLRQVSETIWEKIVEQMLSFYAENKYSESAFLPQQKIEEAIIYLWEHSPSRAAIENVFVREINSEKAADLHLAAARLCYRANIYTPRLTEAVGEALSSDDERWNFPLDTMLRTAIVANPELVQLRKLPLRRLLQNQPVLLEKIKNDLGWLRLIIALYGGIGKNPGTGEMIFSAEFIYHDSPLTDLIRDALQYEDSPCSLVPRLYKRLSEQPRRYSHPDCLVALVALEADTGQFIEVVSPIRPEVSSRALTQLKCIIAGLRDVLKNANSEITQSLLKNASELPAALWIEAYGNLISNLLRSGITPSNLWQGLELLEDERLDYATAEAWAAGFSIPHDDNVYNIAVVLDTTGPKLSLSPAQVVRAFAAAFQLDRPEYERWRLERLPLSPEDDSDIIVAALTAVSAVEPRFEYVKSWALEKMAPILLERSDWTIEALIIIATLGWQDFRRAALEKFSFQAVNLKTLLSQIRGLILELENPAARASALTRFFKHFPFACFDLLPDLARSARQISSPQKRAAVMSQIIPLHNAIKPQLRWLAPELADDFFTVSKFLEIIEEITEPEIKVRLLAKTSQITLDTERIELMSRAFVCLKQINDFRERAGLLLLLKEFTAGSSVLLNLWNSEVEKLFGFLPPASDGDGPHKAASENRETQVLSPDGSENKDDSDAKSRNAVRDMSNIINRRMAPSLLKAESCMKHHDQFQTLEWSLVTLSALAHDAASQLAPPADVFGLYKAADDSIHGEAALLALRKRGEERNLILTITLARILDRFFENGEIDLFKSLIRLVEHSDSEAVPLIEKWLLSADEYIFKVSSLLLAEAGRITKAAVPALCDLLHDSDDLIRCRTHLMLYENSNDERFKVSELGRETVEEFMKQQRLRDDDPEVGTALIWFWEEKILHDSPVALSEWLAAIKTDPKPAADALSILTNIYRLSSDTWIIYREALSENSEKIRSALLKSAKSILNYDGLQEDEYKELHTLLRQLIVNTSGEIRRLAIRAMSESRLAAADDFKVLSEMLKSDPDLETAETIVIGLGRMSSKTRDEGFKNSVVDFLISQRRTFSPEINKCAVGSLIRIELKKLSNIKQGIENLEKTLPENASTQDTSNLEGLRRRRLEITEKLVGLIGNFCEEAGFLAGLEAIFIAGRDSYWSDYHDLLVNFAGDFIYRHPERFLNVIFERAQFTLQEYLGGKHQEKFSDASTILSICAEVSRLMPASARDAVSKNNFEQLLFYAFDCCENWVVRRAVVELFGFASTENVDVAYLLRNAVKDVNRVQEQAFLTARRFNWFVDESDKTLSSVINEIKKEVESDGSPAVVFALAELLTVLAGGDKTVGKQKRLILQTLSEIIQTPFSRKKVFRLDRDENGNTKIKSLPQLDQRLRECLLEVMTSNRR